MDANIEEWRDIPGYEGLYMVSDEGKVWSIPREIVRSDGIRSKVPGGTLKGELVRGYPAVNIRNNGKGKVAYIHRLVMLAFIGPRPDGLYVCHNNGDRTDNRLQNLRYDTPSENSYDRCRHGTDHESNKTHCKRGHPLEFPNLVPSTLKNGSRSCLACSRARSYVYRKEALSRTFKEISDSYFVEVMNNA